MKNYIKATSTQVSPANFEEWKRAAGQMRAGDGFEAPRAQHQFWFFDDARPSEVADAVARAKGLRDLLTTRGHRVLVSVWRSIPSVPYREVGVPSATNERQGWRAA